MIAAAATLAFTAAAALAIGTIAASVAPQWRRIACLAAGYADRFAGDHDAYAHRL